MPQLESVDLPGVMGGSRLLEQPRYRAEVERWQAFLALPGPALLEIGFDHGRRLTETAARHPAWRVIGMEVRERRVTEARAWAEEHELHNLLAWRVDARSVLAQYTPPGRLSVIEALFPVPWTTPATARRALLDARLLDDAARALAPGGLLHIATDVVELAEQLDGLLADHPRLRHDPAAASVRPPIEARSRREWKCEREGLPIYRRWIRRSHG